MHGCLQTNLYQQGLQLTALKVLSTTQSVPNAYTVSCPNGAIESVCIGGLIFHLLAPTLSGLLLWLNHFTECSQTLLHCTKMRM